MKKIPLNRGFTTSKINDKFYQYKIQKLTKVPQIRAVQIKHNFPSCKLQQQKEVIEKFLIHKSYFE